MQTELRNSRSDSAAFQEHGDAHNSAGAAGYGVSHRLCQQSWSRHFRREWIKVNSLLLRVWRLIKVQGDHPKPPAHNLQKTLPGFAEEERNLLLGDGRAYRKVGNATGERAPGALCISYLFSLMFDVFQCQK